LERYWLSNVGQTGHASDYIICIWPGARGSQGELIKTRDSIPSPVDCIRPQRLFDFFF